jgi:flavin-dependent thymidylate synthase
MLANPPENSEEEHGTPFEKSYLGFLVRVDTVTHYQILKHRVAVSVNTESARYKGFTAPSCHIPDDWPADWQEYLKHHHDQCSIMYQEALAELEPILGRKRAKESARFFLPLANELTMDVSFNFRSFVHFMRLRNHDTAQKEINDLAEVMLNQVRATGAFEHSLAAFDL